VLKDVNGVLVPVPMVEAFSELMPDEVDTLFLAACLSVMVV
jgi:hypothetical protein